MTDMEVLIDSLLVFSALFVALIVHMPVEKAAASAMGVTFAVMTILTYIAPIKDATERNTN